ncbi:cytochrome P450 [Polyporus arcularius HHB13444]|uniref:Cytochrome P450 n=1 Tax=Polyporus arcularius HHB13444 TaxID=1314778 RepID=A0A5C3P096_9APHY|nr:cytochrome P450 [Polyporus arcularius HHB13444]
MVMSVLLLLLALVPVAGLLRVLQRYLTKSPLDNIPGPPLSDSLLFGNVHQIRNPLTAGKLTASLCDTYGPAHRIHGVLGERLLHVFDPRALHNILAGDMEHFPKEVTPLNTLSLLLGPGILATNGPQHRRQRKLLSSAFTQAHLRDITTSMYDVAHKLLEIMTGKHGEELDINALMVKTVFEISGEALLGYSFGSFAEGEEDSFGECVKQFFATVGKVPLIAFVVPWLSRFLSGPLIVRLFRIIPFSPNLQRLLDISEALRHRATKIVQVKKAALMKGDEEQLDSAGEGKDIMSLLLKANMAAYEEDKISDAELIAQVSTVMLAGLDPTSNGLSRLLYTLAQNQAAQERLRAELLEAHVNESTGPGIPPHELMRLPYLDAVFRETLRLYPPVAFMLRFAAKDVALPLTWPVRGKDGTMMSEIFVPRGTHLVPNLRACNHNQALWGDDALEWKPERWMGELPRELLEARVPGVYSHLMTFSAGGRSCIGVKFAELEMKIVLSVLLMAFKFDLTEKPVVWNFSVVEYPTMGESSTKPELLLKVTPL